MAFSYDYKGTNYISPRPIVMLDKAPDIAAYGNPTYYQPKEGIYNGQVGKFYNLKVNDPTWQQQTGNPWRADTDSYIGPTVYNTNLIGPGSQNNPGREREVYAIGFIANDDQPGSSDKSGPLIDTPKATTGEANASAAPQQAQPTNGGGKRRPRRTLLLSNGEESLLGA